MKFGNINMKETDFAPGGHPKTHPREYAKNFLKPQMCQIYDSDYVIQKIK